MPLQKRTNPMKMSGRGSIFALMMLLMLGSRVSGVIEVDDSVAKTFATSKAVWTGTVQSVDAAKSLIVIKGTDSYKGDPVPALMNLVAGSPPDFVSRVSVGTPIVLFLDKHSAGAALHLADTWLLASGIPGSTPPVWKAMGIFEKNNKSFPGRTVAMVRLLDEIKAGKPTLLTKTENNLFRTGLKSRTKLDVSKPTFLLAADINHDGKPDLIVGSAGGIKLLLAKADAWVDATAAWGLANAKGEAHAAGDVNGDGKIDLLLGNEIYLNDGQKFAPAGAKLAIPESAVVIASALSDVTGDGKPDAIILLADGRLLVFQNPGAAGTPWTALPPRELFKSEGSAPVAAALGDFGDDGTLHALVVRADGVIRYPINPTGEAPAKYERLSGQALANSSKGLADDLKNAAAIVIDINADHRPDLLIASPAGSVLLVNRGFGTFLPIPDPAAALVGPEAKVTLGPKVVWTAADLRGDGFDDLLILGPDGTLSEADNSPK